MSDESGREPPDTEPAFQKDAFQSNAFQVKGESLYGAMSLAFAGILYTALITVVGVVVAMIPVHGWARIASVSAYVAFAVLAFILGVTKGRGPVIHFARKLLQLPPSGG